MCAGILWNLSSKDNLKEKLARETLPELTDKILIPLSGGGESEALQQTPSEADIFYNTTGCLRCTSLICVFSLWLQHAPSLKYISSWFTMHDFSPITSFSFWGTCSGRTLQLTWQLSPHPLMLFHKKLQPPVALALFMCTLESFLSPYLLSFGGYLQCSLHGIYYAAQCQEWKLTPKPNCTAISSKSNHMHGS